MTSERPVVSEVSGAAGPDVPDEPNWAHGDVIKAALSHGNVHDAVMEAVLQMEDCIDAEVAAAVSGCRRDQESLRGRIEALIFGHEDQRHVPGCAGEDTCPACWVADLRAALAGEVNPE